MSILNRTIKNLIYRKTIYTLICLILSIVGVFLVISINMEESAKTVKKTTLDNLNPTGLLYHDPFVEFDPNKPIAIDIDVVKEMAKHQSVNSATIYYESQATLSVGEITRGMISYWAHGYENPVEFRKGMFELLEGRFLSKEDLERNVRFVVVEERFAEERDLELGDKIFLSFTTSDKYDYEIIGIYRNNKDSVVDYEPLHPKNLVHISYNTFASDLGLGEDPTIQRSTFELRSGLEAAEFKKFAENLLLDTDFLMDVDLNYLIRVMKPLDVIVSVARLSKYLAVITITLILSVLSVLIVKDREYEIGILLAIGESKFKIVSQLLLELIILTIISISISFPIGSLIAKENSKLILEQQMNFFQEREGKLSFSSSTFDYEDYLPSIDRSKMLLNYEVVSIDYIDNVLLYILIICSISVVISSIPILNKSPKFLLERRS